MSTDWMRGGLCAQVDPEPWFGEKGSSPAPAKRICARCPVQATCRDYAIPRPELEGIWGGMTYKERSIRRNAIESRAVA